MSGKHEASVTKMTLFGAGSRNKRFRLPGSRRLWTMCAVTLCFAIALSFILLNKQMGFAVYMNGEELGSAKSLDEVTEVVSTAEEKLTRLLGYEYNLNDSISVATAVVLSGTEADKLESAILSGVDEVSLLYSIKVDGRTVGALENRAELEGLLSDILDRYTADNTTSVRFAENIVISQEYVSASVPSTAEEISALLNPNNVNSDVSLTVLSTSGVTTTEAVPYEYEYRDDPGMYEGSYKLITAGVNGELVRSEFVDYVNGVETVRRSAGELITRQPVTEVAVRGTAPRPATASYGAYIWPARGELTSYFGYRDSAVGSSNHQGLDIAGVYGQAICASDGGEVVFADYDGSYGYIVRIRHDNGAVTWYAHCSALLVQVGQRVAQGDVIAEMGSTGDSTGDHVHFELRVDGEPQDPLCVLPW